MAVEQRLRSNCSNRWSDHGAAGSWSYTPRAKGRADWYALLEYPPVVKHGNGKWTIYRWFPIKPFIHNGFSIAMFDYRRVLMGSTCANNNLDQFWLVVSTPLKNISQLGWVFPIYGKIKHVPNHQPEFSGFRWVLHCHWVVPEFEGR